MGYVSSEYYSLLIRQSTIPRVLTAPSTRKALRIIYYPSALAQWLFLISDYKFYPMSLHGTGYVPLEYYSLLIR